MAIKAGGLNILSKVGSVSDRSISKYQDQWNNMVIDPKRIDEVINAAKTIIKYRKRFEVVAESYAGKIPWYFLGIIYYREDSCSFKDHIHNGDSLRQRTVNVPKGRPLKIPANKGQGYSFEESALDLILLKGYDKVPIWSIETLLYYFEANNGFGYRRLKVPIDTPYVWSGTTYYKSGKFVADGKYDRFKVDEQIGCAPLLRYLTDKTLKLV